MPHFAAYTSFLYVLFLYNHPIIQHPVYFSSSPAHIFFVLSSLLFLFASYSTSQPLILPLLPLSMTVCPFPHLLILHPICRNPFCSFLIFSDNPSIFSLSLAIPPFPHLLLFDSPPALPPYPRWLLSFLVVFIFSSIYPHLHSSKESCPFYEKERKRDGWGGAGGRCGREFEEF